ncbi:MAG: hypothetical protein LBQ43_01935 [Holosporales bacterium]|nr:hypothetical protein [Holosporales bacterium]
MTSFRGNLVVLGEVCLSIPLISLASQTLSCNPDARNIRYGQHSLSPGIEAAADELALRAKPIVKKQRRLEEETAITIPNMSVTSIKLPRRGTKDSREPKTVSLKKHHVQRPVVILPDELDSEAVPDEPDSGTMSENSRSFVEWVWS